MTGTIRERVWHALNHIAARNVSPDGFTIHMGISAFRTFKREEAFPEDLFGLPVKVNLNMADGEIVLRYEVKA